MTATAGERWGSRPSIATAAGDLQSASRARGSVGSKLLGGDLRGGGILTTLA